MDEKTRVGYLIAVQTPRFWFPKRYSRSKRKKLRIKYREEQKNKTIYRIGFFEKEE